MVINFLHSFQSEWLKTRRSAASWLVITGAFFVPVIMLIAQLISRSRLSSRNLSADFWESLFNKSWEAMAFFLFPMGVILATGLIGQIEYRNNTWKQLYTTPQKLSTIFLAKLTVVLIMILQFFVLFNFGIYLAGIIPSLLLKHVSYPAEPIPLLRFAKANLHYFIDCLPVVALQYILSIRYENFLIPVGIGLTLVVMPMFALTWKYGYIFPYSYCAYNYIDLLDQTKARQGPDIHLLAFSYFIVLTVISYILYIRRREKG